MTLAKELSLQMGALCGKHNVLLTSVNGPGLVLYCTVPRCNRVDEAIADDIRNLKIELMVVLMKNGYSVDVKIRYKIVSDEEWIEISKYMVDKVFGGNVDN